jgi:hypothetical protein
MMRITPPLLVLAASLLSAPVAMALNEYGIEGMGVVSTRADEGRATISADGQRIVFARRGEAGWGLWQARVVDGRWQQAQALPVGVAGEARDPYFSRDGRWLLFAAGREGALALYRAAVAADGQLAGAAAGRRRRAPGRARAGPERGRQAAVVCPPAGPGRRLGPVRGDAGCAGPARPGHALSALNSADDETDGDWLGQDGAVVFSRGSGATAQVWSSGCAWTARRCSRWGCRSTRPAAGPARR